MEDLTRDPLEHVACLLLVDCLLLAARRLLAARSLLDAHCVTASSKHLVRPLHTHTRQSLPILRIHYTSPTNSGRSIPPKSLP